MVFCSNCLQKHNNDTSVDDGECAYCGGALMDSLDPKTPEELRTEAIKQLAMETEERVLAIKQMKGD